MRATLALIRFELERRWMAFAGGLAGGLFVFLLPTIRNTATGPNDIRPLAVAVATATLVVVYSVALGGSLFTNDLAERRASFLFGRPIGGAAMVAGRFLAALLVVVGSATLAALPSLLGGVRLEIPAFGYEFLETPALTALLLIGTIALLLTSSAVLLAARARTLWVVLELAALVGAGLVVTRALALFDEIGLPDAARRLWLGLLVAEFVALAAIYAAAATRGRTDLARAHRAQALVAAAALALTTGGAWLFARDYVSPTLPEIQRGNFNAQVLDEGLLALTGSERGREDLRSWFVLESRTGAWRPAGQSTRHGAWLGEARAVRGGSVYFFRRNDEDFNLELVRAAAGSLERLTTPLSFDRQPSVWSVSEDGELFGRLRRESVEAGVFFELHQIASGRLLKSSRIDGPASLSAQLLPEREGFRLALFVGTGLRSFRIERNGSVQLTGDSALVSDDANWRLDSEHGRVFVRKLENAHQWLVLDSNSLAPLASLRPPLLDVPGATLSQFLVPFGDKSIAILAGTHDTREISLFTGNGELIRAFQFPKEGRRSIPVGAGDDHSLLLASVSDLVAAVPIEDRLVERYDLVTGERRVVARGLASTSWFAVSRPRPAVLRDETGQLFLVDSTTGESKPVAHPLGR